MNEIQTAHQAYGFAVECRAHPDARALVRRFFGSLPVPRTEDPPHLASPAVRVRIDVSDTATAAPVPPPYFPSGWEDADPITIDLVSSRAEISPRAWTVRLALARADAGDQIVYGRWLLEKAFLILVLRSGQHYGLHAGAIVVGGHAVMVTADSGIGKSTFIAHGLRRGADFVGDDALMRHLRDESPRFWGHPRAAHLSPDMVASWPELATAAIAPVPGRDKVRVEWPPAFEPRLRPSIQPEALLFLTRQHADVRPVSVDDAVERCRSDFDAGKRDPAALARVDADVRARFARLTLLELGLSTDLDANFDAVARIFG